MSNLEFVFLSDNILGLCKDGVQEMVSADLLHDCALSEDELAERICVIVKRNLASGRVERAMITSGQHKTLSLSVLKSYVKRVIRCYIKESPRVTALAAKEEAAWADIRQWLLKRTKPYVLKLSTSEASAPNVEDFSQQACEVLLEKLPEYHYDASFAAWLTKILRHIILHPYTRGRDIIDRRPTVASIDQVEANQSSEAFSLWQLLSDPSQSAAFEQLETRMLLADALTHLRSKAQRAVIIYSFDGLSDAEIAQQLGKSSSNVAVLRFRALRRLREILEAQVK